MTPEIQNARILICCLRTEHVDQEHVKLARFVLKGIHSLAPHIQLPQPIDEMEPLDLADMLDGYTTAAEFKLTDAILMAAANN